MLEYNVKATGIEDIERLTKAVDGLERVLISSKGAGKPLEEIRKIIVGLKGQGSVFQELARSIAAIDPAVDKLATSFQGLGTQIVTALKSELQMTRGVLQNELRALAMGIGSPLEKQIASEISSAIEDGTRAGTAKARTAAAKARAEMTAAYDNLVGGDGFKQLSVDQLAEVKMLKDVGAAVSKYHSQMLRNYESDLAQKRKLDKEWYSATTGPGYRSLFEDFSRNLGTDQTIAKSAKESAAIFKAAFAEEAARGRATFANFNSMLGIDRSDVVKSAKESAAIFNAAFAAETRSAKRSAMPVASISKIDAQDATYATAMKQMRDYYTALDPVEKASKGITAASAGMNTSFKQLAVSGNDVHSMARGLASGFNLLWLTWGNLAPLFAGAAISNGFMQTAKAGMEVAHTLEVIQRLGENTAPEIRSLTDELIYLGYNGPRGPKEIAEAFKVLSLAGLKANDVLAVTQTVLDFSTAGTTDLETAAGVLVSVTTAFGTGAAGFERSADIIARAAADSKASVESFGEAMKTASVVGEQYGARQEDVALQIQYLAQLGIQGSSAGTAIRNMYADITGRSGQVTKLLKSLNVDFKDASGAVVPLTEQMRLLAGVLEQYDAKSQGNLIQAIFGERGAKSAIATLQAYQTAAKDSSQYSNKLEEDLARVGNAAGESAINAAYLGQTTKKAFESAGAAFQTTMFTAFQQMEPQLYIMANAFKQAFSSNEAREALADLTGTVADLGVAVANNLKPLAELAVTWGIFRLATAGVNAALTLTSAGLSQYVAWKVSATSATVAATAAERRYAAAVAASGAAGAAAGAATAGRLAALARFLPIIGNAVAIGSAGWMLYSTYMDKAGKSAEDYYNLKSDNIIEALQKENEHLEAVNRERLKGIGLAEAEARVKAAEAESSVRSQYADPVAAQQNVVDPLRAKYESYRTFDMAAANSVLMQLRPEEEKLNKLLAERQKRLDALAKVEEERRKNAQDAFLISQAENAKAAQEAQNVIAKGTKSWNLADWQDSNRSAGRDPGKSFQYYDQEFEAFKKVTEAEKQIVTTLYDQRKIDAESYYDWLQNRSQMTYEAERTAMQQRITEFSGDPKSQKALREAQTNLQVLDIKYSAEALKLEQERNKAIAERLTPMQQINSAGEERLRKAETPNGDLIAITRGGSFAQDAAERIRIDNSYADMRLEVEKRYNREIVGLADEGVALRNAVREQELAAIQEFADREYSIYRRNEDKKESERDKYSNGVRRAYEDYMKSSTDYASMAASAVSNALSSLESQFANFVRTGKLSLIDFANVAVEQLARIAAQQAVSGLAGLGSTLFDGVMGFFANAKGGVYDSPSLSKYSNQVHSSPKFFAFAQGAGVFGEAGPEAIMPLTRGPDGNLGVRTYAPSGAGSAGKGGDVYITIATEINSSGAANTQVTATPTATANDKAVGEALNQKVRELIARETLNGGIIWRFVNGR